MAVDQRGYGRSSKFWRSEAYRIGPLVADVVGLVKALGAETAVVDADWQDLAPHAERKLTVPSYFLGAEFDVATWWGAESLARVKEKATDYRGGVILERCGHWLQQERPEETNAVLLDFLRGLD